MVVAPRRRFSAAPAAMPERFSADEAHAIFARAARRQEAVRDADERARAGLTLAELQAVGAEVGIDPGHIEAAAAALAAGEPAPVANVLGVPERIYAVRTLPAPLGDAAWVALVDALRESFGHAGTAEQLGGRRTWSVPDVVTSRGLSVRVEGDTVTLEGPLPVASGYASALVPVALMVFFLAGTFEPYVPLLMLLMALVAVLGTRFGLPARARVQERRFHAAVDHVELSMLRAEGEVREESRLDGPADRPADAATEAGRIDPALLESEGHAETARRRRRDRA